MKRNTVRILNLEICNFKNVKHGIIDFEDQKSGFEASILGLYGQNGSGKTALIDAISLLKFALSGQPVPAFFSDYINIDSPNAELKFGFRIEDNDKKAMYNVFYKFCLEKKENNLGYNTEQSVAADVSYKAIITNEVLSSSYKTEDQSRIMTPIVNTCTNEVFLPLTKYRILVGDNPQNETDLMSYKKLALATSKSFIFSKELLDVIRQNCKEDYLSNLFESLVWYGNYELFVINTTTSGLITMNALPLSFRYEEKGHASYGSFMLNLNEATLVPKELFNLASKLVDSMNVVLPRLVPNLKIGIKKLGSELFPTGAIGIKIQLISLKNGKEIPLKYESEGIKKIISVLQLLIVLYNDPSITVAIDELDSGVFEYLLGELLKIISERGKGQLIFTSHNLRPLETLDRKFVAFTTTNPSNRYFKITNVKANNNLRNLYYRDIILDEQKETLYDATDNYEIAYSLREAGESHGR